MTSAYQSQQVSNGTHTLKKQTIRNNDTGYKRVKIKLKQNDKCNSN